MGVQKDGKNGVVRARLIRDILKIKYLVAMCVLTVARFVQSERGTFCCHRMMIRMDGARAARSEQAGRRVYAFTDLLDQRVRSA